METEDLFRSANDRIAEKGHEFCWRFRVPLLCECSDRRCLTRVNVTLEEYERARSHPQGYLTVPGHEVAGAFVIEEGDSVTLVEKLHASTR